MKSSNNYWKGFEELNDSAQFAESKSNEFHEGLPLDKVFSDDDSYRANRRDFLKYFGFSVSAVALAACNRTPVKYAMPYATQPANVTPGMPLYYASSSVSDYEGFPVLVKVREGRPIKFEPNKEAAFFGGGMDGLAHASILSLYDTNRVKGPMRKDVPEYGWEAADKDIVAGLKQAGRIAIVHRPSTSLVQSKAIEAFKAAYPNTDTYAYDSKSYSGILRANERSYGKKAIPTYHFQNADVIVSFAADFLGTWINPVKYSADYGVNRVPTKDGKMSKHIQFESLMSLTGANADVRVPMRVSNMGKHLVTLYNEIAKAMGVATLSGDTMELAGDAIKHAAADLVAAKGKALVICGSNDADEQSLVNAINGLLGSNGSTIDMTHTFNGFTADEADFDRFVNQAKAGTYGAAIYIDCNPAYAGGADAEAAMSKIAMNVSNGLIVDETAAACQIVAPNLHALESWDIKQPYTGRFVMNQPTISPVFDGRSTAESLMVWAGASVEGGEQGYMYDLTKRVFDEQVGGDFNNALEQGFVDKAAAPAIVSDATDASAAAAAVAGRGAGTSDLIIYEKVGVRDGSFANNPWAHEMPDPVTKVCWDNYLSVSKPDADALGIDDGDTVTVSMGDVSFSNFPVLIQPGQAKGTYGIAMGYGRTYTEDVTNDMKDLGQNASAFVQMNNGSRSFISTGEVSISKDGKYELARTQSHQTIEGRDIVREATLDEYVADPKVRNHHKHNLVSLWDSHDYSKGHHWAMAIDLNSCTGCSSCIVSCSIENNVPIVGRDEVRRRREMHWLRIDRYYSFQVSQDAHIDIDFVEGEADLKAGEYITEEKQIDSYSSQVNTDHYSNVKVIHQPMLCQHCDNAPCETVCPVLATTHSTEGLNQMTYNRCIGTKYCANNCPYKVRRFNWFRFNENKKFDYHFSNDLGKMVINPDVTVRSRGVMEKCSFCVQRIQYAKLEAKKQNRKMNTDEFTTACAQTCPSNAIIFGDLNDPNSEISKLYKNERAYHVVEELDTKPSIAYMTKIRNAKEESTQAHH